MIQLFWIQTFGQHQEFFVTPRHLPPVPFRVQAVRGVALIIDFANLNRKSKEDFLSFGVDLY